MLIDRSQIERLMTKVDAEMARRDTVPAKREIAVARAARDAADDRRDPPTAVTERCDPPSVRRRTDRPSPSVAPQPLLSPSDARLLAPLADRIAVAASGCTVHAGVALRRFVRAERPVAPDLLDGLSADFLVADREGRPLAVLMHVPDEGTDERSLLAEALETVALPVLEIGAEDSIESLWPRLAIHLQTEDGGPARPR